MNLYADTSFLFSLYLVDGNTPRALAFKPSLTAPIPFTDFQSVEFRNAIELAVFRSRITAAKALEVWGDVETDLQNGFFAAPSVAWPDVLREAQRLAAQYTASTGARTLDILHVALARLLGAMDFVTFDIRQAALARRVGLDVKP